MAEVKTETKPKRTRKPKETNKNLTLSAVTKQAKSTHEKNVYELDNGSTITHYITFPDLLIESMLEELQKHYLTIKEKDIELSEKMNLYFINLLIIKHFTHFKDSMTDTLLGEENEVGLLDYLNYFADTGLMKTIMEDVFLPSQVNKVYEKMTDIIGASKLLDELGVKAEQKFQNLKIKNREILGQFDDENNNVSNVLADK